MPVIETIDSIKILMYFRDHLPPHFHAVYNEYEVLIEIKTLAIYQSRLPTKQQRKVLNWARKNKAFLLEKWEEFNPNK
jgi:predicted metallo-beta-lactamase superfamily hydrolase